MPVSFSRLRIAGFKSFAEPVVVDILPGLTGIVGPNGCGKSNVVEALRWAMGETSARSMRGGEMDDVIFAGTAHRASRNLAEVTLHLADTQGTAPPPFHEAPELEISRRIERGSGSAYRINGREARARDVQTLFADLATGAHSSGLVSQGTVGSLVNARPDDRRAILEEAAGITGLHSRRHEAELKLRAAEANLARAEDLRGQLETQLEGLKRQARQANRYRTISGLIRNAEAELLAIQRAKVEHARADARAALAEAEAAVAAATAAATAASAAAAEATARLPALRETEGQARTALERHRLAREQIAAEETRAREALAAAAARLEQVVRDLAHAEQTSRDAVAAMARLDEEAARLAEADAAHPARLAQAEAAAAEAEDAARAADAEANRATEHAAELAASHRALSEALQTAEARAQRLTEQHARLTAEQREVAALLVDPAELAAADAACGERQAALDAARAALEATEQTRAAALQHAAAARAAAVEEAQRLRASATETAARLRRTAQETAAALRRSANAQAVALREAARDQGAKRRADAEAALTAAREQATAAELLRTRLEAEAQALAEVLSVKDGERWPRMVDQLEVPAGLEAALGAALGEELEFGGRHRRRPALARTEAARPAAGAARWRHPAGGVGARAGRAGARPVANRAGGGWRRGAARPAARTDAGVARGRGVALGRLCHPGRHADRRRHQAAAAQPVCRTARPPRRRHRSRRSRPGRPRRSRGGKSDRAHRVGRRRTRRRGRGGRHRTQRRHRSGNHRTQCPQ